MATDRLWPVSFDGFAWAADFRGASSNAREQAARWRGRIEGAGGLPQLHLIKCDEKHDQLPLPRCVKVRIPNPHSADLKDSPWGAVLELKREGQSLVLLYLAFALRHPEAAGSFRPSVYEIAHQRLNG